MQAHFGVWQAIVSGMSAVATIAFGFMLERLLLMTWPWWAWGVTGTLAIVVAIFASWMQSRLLAKRGREWEVIAYYDVPNTPAERGLRVLIDALTKGAFSPVQQHPRQIRNKVTGEIRELSRDARTGYRSTP